MCRASAQAINRTHLEFRHRLGASSQPVQNPCTVPIRKRSPPSLRRHVAHLENVDFHVTSTCIHNFHAKNNFPLTSPFHSFTSPCENPPGSQQTSASNCNGQLRCTAVLCTVPRNRYFLFSQHSRHRLILSSPFGFNKNLPMPTLISSPKSCRLAMTWLGEFTAIGVCSQMTVRRAADW